jgi:hypothetical protein
MSTVLWRTGGVPMGPKGEDEAGINEWGVMLVSGCG